MATLRTIKDFMSTPEKPVQLSEMKALTKEDREYLSNEYDKVYGDDKS